jgi:hypothetical protein
MILVAALGVNTRTLKNYACVIDDNPKRKMQTCATRPKLPFTCIGELDETERGSGIHAFKIAACIGWPAGTAIRGKMYSFEPNEILTDCAG